MLSCVFPYIFIFSITHIQFGLIVLSHVANSHFIQPFIFTCSGVQKCLKLREVGQENRKRCCPCQK